MTRARLTNQRIFIERKAKSENERAVANEVESAKSIERENATETETERETTADRVVEVEVEAKTEIKSETGNEKRRKLVIVNAIESVTMNVRKIESESETERKRRNEKIVKDKNGWRKRREIKKRGKMKKRELREISRS